MSRSSGGEDEMLPGKHYTPDDVLAIFRRRYWLLLVPCAMAAAATALVARRLPERYRSEAVVLVVPQQVPEMYVRSGGARVEDRVQVTSQEILSRARLERIINDFDLYPQEKRATVIENVVEKLRNDISVGAVKGNTFKVAYVGSDPKIVQKVTTALASLFIEESTRDRSVLVEGTTQFLQLQLDDARRRLVEQEKKLEVYRVRFSGHLPSQLTANLQALQNTQMQIQTTLESINHDRDQRLVLAGQLADLSANVPDETMPTSAAAGDAPNSGTTVQQLAAARTLLVTLSQRYKAGYPEISRVQRLIRDLERQLDAEALGLTPAAAPGTTASVVSAASLKQEARLKRMKDLQVQLDQIDARIAASQQNETRLRTDAADYQQRVDQVPARESEMIELTRDYGTLQSVYTNLLSKKEESNIAANLERREVGEQFRLLDPALIAGRPFSPNRIAITFYGIAAGLAVGFGIIVLLEYRDTSFRTDSEIASVLALPVLSVVPLMVSTFERRRNIWRRRVLDTALGSTVAVCGAIVIYTLVR